MYINTGKIKPPFIYPIENEAYINWHKRIFINYECCPICSGRLPLNYWICPECINGWQSFFNSYPRESNWQRQVYQILNDEILKGTITFER